MICHITTKSVWNKALKNKSYKPESLSVEGFIHCSPPDKIYEVANRFFKGQKDLVIIYVDESKVKSRIINEDLYGHGYDFPHIYGELNIDAITDTVDFSVNENGEFILSK